MNGIGFSFNPAALARASAPTQSQVNQQAASGGGTLAAKDAFEKTRKQREMGKIVNPKLATAKITQQAKKVGKKGKA